MGSRSPPAMLSPGAAGGGEEGGRSEKTRKQGSDGEEEQKPKAKEPEPEEGRAPSPPRADVDRCYARLGHVSSYTGIYRQRFDAKGRGQGIPNSAEGNLDLSQVTRPRLNPVRTLPSPADKKRAAAKGSGSRRRGGSKATKDREARGARRRQQVQR